MALHDVWDKTPSGKGYYKDFAEALVIRCVDDNIKSGAVTPNHGLVCWSRNAIPGQPFWICANQSASEFFIDHLQRMRQDSHPRVAEFEQIAASQAEHVAEQFIVALEGAGVYNQTRDPEHPNFVPSWSSPGGENTFQHAFDVVNNPFPTYVGNEDTDSDRHTSVCGLIAACVDNNIRSKMADVNTVYHAISLHLEWVCGRGFNGNIVDPSRIPGRKPGETIRNYKEPGLAYGIWPQIRAFMWMHKLTGNREWLNTIKDFMDFHMKDANSRSTVQNGKVYYTWDTGRVATDPVWRLGGTEMNNDGQGDIVKRYKGTVGAEFTQQNWYHAQMTSTLYLIIEEMEFDDANYWQSEILHYEDIILKYTQWLAWENRSSSGPVGDMWTNELGPGVSQMTVHPTTRINALTGDRNLINLQVHGGLSPSTTSLGRYLQFDDVANILTPSEWDGLALNDPYYPLFGMQHHEPDGRYYQFFYTQDPGTPPFAQKNRRIHFQKFWEDAQWQYGPNSSNPRVQPGGDLYNTFLRNLPQGPFSKNLTQDNYEVANAAWVRYKILEKRNSCGTYAEDKLWAEWLVHDGYGWTDSGARKGLAEKTPRTSTNPQHRAPAMTWSRGARALMFVLRAGQTAAGDTFGAGTRFMRYDGPTLPTDP